VSDISTQFVIKLVKSGLLVGVDTSVGMFVVVGTTNTVAVIEFAGDPGDEQLLISKLTSIIKIEDRFLKTIMNFLPS